LESLYQETKKKYAALSDEIKLLDTSTAYTPEQEAKWKEHVDMWNDLRDMEIEKMRRQFKLNQLSKEDLQEMAHDAYRSIRRMENYDWDIVQNSSEENQRGFHERINALEDELSAANLELDRRCYIEYEVAEKEVS
jgi:hypothetical protein